ncbi:hypothetical protein [Pedobacter borealis]|uniref:hypothetical protein n=1 Tax=Pedobacter borealis TaxID=475254 RepID=UPI0004931390|nr:hypothetical protein [Pedobacter borealis]
MSLIFYPLFVVAVIISFFIFGKKRVNKAIEEPPLINDEPLIPKPIKPAYNPKFKWSVLVKSYKGTVLDFEDDDLGKVGYYIFNNHKSQLIQRQIIVYIKDNQENKYLRIISDGSSESMIGVDHPTHGHIGYLSFEEVGTLIDKVGFL